MGTGSRALVISVGRLFGEARGDLCKVTKGVELKVEVSIEGIGSSGELKECGRHDDLSVGTCSNV